MITVKSKRVLIVILALSMCVNAFLIGILASASHGLRLAVRFSSSDPQQVVRERIEKAINKLPEPYRTEAKQQYDTFTMKYNPLIEEIKTERKIFVQMLLATPVDVEKTKAEAGKLRTLSQQLQEGMQNTIVDIAASLPQEEKEKLADHSRLLKSITQ